VVRRPDRIDWSEIGGHTGAMPRDSMLAVGNSIIEAPMSWESRRKEVLAYRNLLREYQNSGARWYSAPRVLDHKMLINSDPATQWAINNTQPAFDAADFLRFGRDIFGQLSHVTNQAGVDWLSNQLEDEYRVHMLEPKDPHAMHIDATITPLRAGLMLFNPDRIDAESLRAAGFGKWELVPAPRPAARVEPPLFMTSTWINMNLLVIDENRVVVEEQDDDMASLIASLGFKPIRCPFRHVHSIGGSFHCATLDVRRRGELRSYL
jgi:glycine amidinotransferase